MRSIKFIVAIIIIFTGFVSAQTDTPLPSGSSDPTGLSGQSFFHRLVFGGSLGAQFGDQTFVDVAPTIGYRVTENLTTGIGITYIYYNYKYYAIVNGNIIVLTDKSNIYGGSIWSQYRVIPEAFLHAEYGILNIAKPKLDPQGYYSGETFRGNVPSLLLGGGYFQALGEHSGFQIMLLWDVIEDQYSPYSNPIIRIGFTAGF